MAMVGGVGWLFALTSRVYVDLGSGSYLGCFITAHQQSFRQVKFSMGVSFCPGGA